MIDMNRTIDLELYGPCSEEEELLPELNDTVAVITERGPVRFITITGVNRTMEGIALYGIGGERLLISDCYLIFTKDEDSTR